MIYCCGRYLEPERVIEPPDNWAKENQVLKIAHCPCHKGLVAELSYFDKKTKEFKTYRPKRAKVQEFINKIQRHCTDAGEKIKYGTKSNQAFVYGLNVQKKSEIHQIAVDFNGTKRLIKKIYINQIHNNVKC